MRSAEKFLGADVTIFGCTKPDLEAAAEDIRQSCRKDVQNIQPVVLDLSKHSQVLFSIQGIDVKSRLTTSGQG